jgi:hypothetical protein
MLQISPATRTRGNLGDAKSDAITLQLAANRFAAAVNKTPLTVDGAIGSLTLSMVRAALQYLATQGINAATASSLLGKVTTTSAVTAGAAGLATFLNDSMDSIRLKTIATQQAAGSPSILTMNYVPAAPIKLPTTPPASAPVPQPGPLVTAAAASQQIVPTNMVLPTAIVGLSPTAKKTLWILGGVAIGLIVLKRLFAPAQAAA